jgi:tetratricopeptide (TPR) repeat protein
VLIALWKPVQLPRTPDEGGTPAMSHTSSSHTLARRAACALVVIALAAPATRRLHAQADEWDKHMKAGEKAYSAGFNQKHYWITNPSNSPASLANFAKAEQELKAALDLTQSFPAGDQRTVKTLGDLAEVYLEQDRFDEAEAAGNQAISLMEKSVGPDSPDLGFALTRLALIYDYANNIDEAAPLWDRSLGILRKAGKVTPLFVSGLEFNELSLNVKNKNASLQICNYIVDLLEATGAPEKDLLGPLARLSVNQTGADKERTDLRIIVIDQKLYGPENLETLRGLNQLAALYSEEGKYTSALALYLQIQNAESRQNTALVIDKSELAKAYAATGKYSQAEEIYKQNIAALDAKPEKNKDLNNIKLDSGLMSLSKVYRQEHKFDEALETIKRAEAIDADLDNSDLAKSNVKILGPPKWLWSSQIEHAEIDREKGDIQGAETLFQHCLGMTEQPGWFAVSGDGRLAFLFDNYATLLRDEGKYDEAEDLYKRALATWAKNRYPDNPDVAGTLTNYAALLRKLNRTEEAEPLEARASAILAAAGAPAPVI